MGDLGGRYAAQAQSEADKLREDTFVDDLQRNAKGLGEVGLTFGTAMLSEVPAGFAALGGMQNEALTRTGQFKGPYRDVPAAEHADRVQSEFTYVPKSAEGRRYLEGLGKFMNTILDPLREGIDTVQQYADEQGAHPALTAIPLAAATAGLELIPGPHDEAAGAGRYARLAQDAADAIPGNRVQPKPIDVATGPITTPGAKTTNMARRVGTTGHYRGAPADVDTPAKLGQMRKSLKESLERGVPGRSWYDRSSQSAYDLTAGRKGLRDQYTGSIAVTSADTSVPANTGFAIKGYNQIQVGDDILTGRYPNNMGPKISQISTPEGLDLTNKTGPFYEALNVFDQADTIRPTNDLWMARAFNYRRNGQEWTAGLGEAQHRFMDDEIARLVDVANKEKIGGFDDWTPERVQAAIWVDTKARREGTSIERAATDFASDLDARSVNITSESAPSSSLNHMSGVYEDPSRAKIAFDAQNELLTDNAGRNVFSVHANALSRPLETGVGVYQGQSNPVAVNRILAGTETGSPIMDPSSRKLTESIAATEGLVKGQDSVGYNFIRPAKKAADRNAAIGPVRDIKDVQGKLDEVFGGDVIATPSSEGVRYLYVGGEALDKAGQKQLRDIVGKDIQFGVNSGDLIGADSYKPSAYLEKIDPVVGQNLDDITRWSAQALDELDNVLVREFPDAGARSSILQQTRQALSEGGLERVKELVKQGVLPGVVVAVLVSQEPSSSEQSL